MTRVGCARHYVFAHSSEHGTDTFQITDTLHKPDEAEPGYRSASPMRFPSPFRYTDLSMKIAYAPPDNDDTYLELGDATLSNFHFLRMCNMIDYHAWMEDEGLNMSLESLRQNKKCADHHIDVISTNLVQVLYMTFRLQDHNDPHWNKNKERWNDKRWIFIPINNGISGEEAETLSAGSHWALVIMDRVHKRAFYYDSMGIKDDAIQLIAYHVTIALLKVLAEDMGLWKWKPQEYTPNQWRDNQTEGDVGPCGPFVWQMCRIMIDQIIEHQLHDQEQGCDLRLDSSFPSWFGKQFASYHVRLAMYHLVAHYKCRQVPMRLIDEHDQAAIQGEDVVLSGELPMSYGLTPWEKEQRRLAAIAAQEAEQDPDGGVSLDDHLSDDDSEPSTAVSEPAQDISLDGSSDEEETTDGGDDRHRSLKQRVSDEEKYWGLDGISDSVRAAPAATLVRPATPFVAEDDRDHEMQGTTFSGTRRTPPSSKRVRSTSPMRDVADEEPNARDRRYRQHRRQDSDTWSTSANP